MLGLGMGELVLLALVGFFVIGPERLPGAIRSLAFESAGLSLEVEISADAVVGQLSPAAVTRIEAEWPAFCVETQAIVAALSDRIAREERELYRHIN